MNNEELDYTLNNFTTNIKEQFEREYTKGYNQGIKEAFKLVRNYLTKMENQTNE